MARSQAYFQQDSVYRDTAYRTGALKQNAGERRGLVTRDFPSPWASNISGAFRGDVPSRFRFRLAAEVPVMAQIFVSHSAKDKELVAPLSKAFASTPVMAIDAILKGPVNAARIAQDIRQSNAVCVLLGRHVEELRHTRDWVAGSAAGVHCPGFTRWRLCPRRRSPQQRAPQNAEGYTLKEAFQAWVIFSGTRQGFQAA